MTQIKRSFGFLMVFFFMFSSLAFAADEKMIEVTIPTADDATMLALIGELEAEKKLDVELKTGSKVTSTKMFSYTSGKLLFYPDVFEAATTKTQKQALKNFVQGLQKSDVEQQTQQKVMDELSSKHKNVSVLMIPMVFDDTSADIYGAMKIVGPALGILDIVLGIGVVILMFLIVINSIVDLAYIGIPIARENMQNRSGKGGGGGGSKIPFLSVDAISVMRDVEAMLGQTGEYKNAYWMYLKRRITSYIVLGACILFLALGGLSELLSFFLSLFSGVFN